MSFLAYPISKQTGRHLSSLGILINPELCRLFVLDVSDDGYVVEVQHYDGHTEQVWIEGDLPKHVHFLNPEPTH